MRTSSTRRCTLAAGLALLLTGGAARPAVGSQDTDWKAFRQAYPFHAQVREATAPFFYEAIAGQLTAQEALDKMAAAAEDEMKKLGYRK